VRQFYFAMTYKFTQYVVNQDAKKDFDALPLDA
jgi:hypothetical protein